VCPAWFGLTAAGGYAGGCNPQIERNHLDAMAAGQQVPGALESLSLIIDGTDVNLGVGEPSRSSKQIMLGAYSFAGGPLAFFQTEGSAPDDIGQRGKSAGRHELDGGPQGITCRQSQEASQVSRLRCDHKDTFHSTMYRS